MKLPPVQRIKEYLRRIFSNDIMKVFTGNVIGGIIYACCLPLISRLFSKDAFGNFQLVFSAVTVFTTAAALRFDKLIIFSKTEKEMSKPITLSVIVTVLFTILLTLALAYKGAYLLHFLKAEAVSSYYLLIAVGVLFEGLLLIASEIIVRQKKINEFSFIKALTLGLYGISPIILCLISRSFVVLVIARLAVYAITMGYFIFKLNVFNDFKYEGAGQLLRYAKANFKFPLFQLPGSTINNFAAEMPVFLFYSYFGPETVALYSMAYRILQMPASLISNSTTTIYFNEASEIYHHTPARLAPHYLKTLKNLGIVSLLPLPFLLLPFFPGLVGWALGSNWTEAGTYIQVLYPTVFFSLLVTSVGSAFIVVHKQEYIFLLSLFSLGIRFFALYFFKANVLHALVAYSIASCVFYFVYLVLLYYFVARVSTKAEYRPKTDTGNA